MSSSMPPPPTPSSPLTSLVERALHVERVPLPAAASPAATAVAAATGVTPSAAAGADDNDLAAPRGRYELFRCEERQLWKPVRARGVFGRAFATRHVEAIQNGRRIFVISCSFQIPEKSLTYQTEMPEVPPPESLISHDDYFRKWISNPRTDPRAREYFELRLQEPIATEFRPCQPLRQRDWFVPPEPNSRQMIWMRAKGTLPDDLRFHQCVAGYTSDHYLVGMGAKVHGISNFTDPQISLLASLDHTIWFHAPFRADDWLLYVMECTRTGSGRALCNSKVYSRDGTLVYSCAQEGVMRFSSNPKPLGLPPQPLANTATPTASKAAAAAVTANRDRAAETAKTSTARL
ncbi:hypothetical protein HK405_009927 [Cladochytrium tenue]|nr:hypothetical protein HK405_009927 [Cladochytrium tenue]